jgi:hypothetical protein
MTQNNTNEREQATLPDPEIFNLEWLFPDCEQWKSNKLSSASQHPDVAF